MMSDGLSAVLVPGPVQTWKFSRILGSEISIGFLRSAPLIMILTVLPFACSDVETLGISIALSKTAMVTFTGTSLDTLRGVNLELYS